LGHLTGKFAAVLNKLKKPDKVITLKFSIDGRTEEYDFPLDNLNITIGREKECDVVLEHNSVSRKHARLWLENGELWIEDLGSKNGTFIQNKLVTTKMRVDQDLTLGRVDLTVMYHAPGEPPKQDKKDNSKVNISAWYLIAGISFSIIGIGILILTLLIYF